MRKDSRSIKRINASFLNMEHYKIYQTTHLYQSFGKKQIRVNDFSANKYSVDKKIWFKTSILRSDLCDYSDAYIVVKE